MSLRTAATIVLALASGAVLSGASSTEVVRDDLHGPYTQALPVCDSSGGLCLEGGESFHHTANEVTDGRMITVPDSPIRLALWTEVLPDGRDVPFYAISLDGKKMATVRSTSYVVKLRHGDFDPGVGIPQVQGALASDQDTDLYIVQFVTQPLEEFRTAIEKRGGLVYQYLANHAHIVHMNADVRAQVAALPFVRWVGFYHPAYRLEDVLLEELAQPGAAQTKRRYHIHVVERGPRQKAIVADRVRAIGGTVDDVYADGFLLDATLTPAQLSETVRMNEVLFIDRWLPPQTYMNNVREDGGANHIETVAGYTGAGVRGEVMDSGLMTAHSDFQARPAIIHGGNGSSTSHGTSVYGINFGDGTGDGSARGMVPDAQGIFASYSAFGDRYVHTSELVQDPYYAVYQTHSWGSCCTTQYGTESELMDEMIFDLDLIILQAQANDGSQSSDVSAWAKNVVSVGGIRHYGTLQRSDDAWSFAGSIGPAADGRIKPDLSYWYDDIRTTSNSGGYTSSFGGTSAATPETAGHFGLLFQMWADGIFGNEVDPGGTVFDNRPHAATAKALMINTAEQYAFAGTGHDLTRTHQGWGTANVGNLYDLRNKISVIDETVVLENLQSAGFFAYVDAGEPALRVTMVYTDPPGTTSSSQHRINDLTLKVTSPSDVVYWGNNGLLTGNWSTAGGAPNTIDTVENVFIQNPEAGVWTVEVIADEVNQDSHVETPELDADFALVVSGGILSLCSSEGVIGLDATSYACADEAWIKVVDCDLNTDDASIETVVVTIESSTESGGESVVLTETGPLTADFRAAIPLSTTDAAGVLQISPGDVITATYVDADNGLGGTNVVVTDTAAVDCTAPQITNVQTATIEPRNATVTFDTDEFAKGRVHYGTACGALNDTVVRAGFDTKHTLNLSGLDDNASYFYAVEAEDGAGNIATDDNSGSCYSFATPDVPDYFTEQFSGDFDLENQMLTFTPAASADFYCACREGAVDFPTDPTGGTTLSLGDDSFATITLSGGETVLLYGTEYGTFYIGSNGYITFNTGDTEYQVTLSNHFSIPRISAQYVDLNPSSGGTVSWKQLADRVAVTWQNVPEWNTSNSNSFQTELFFDGTIRITWLALDATAGIVGLSDGGGTPPGFLESDHSAYGACPCGDDLGVAPSGAFSSSGIEGGPFTPPCAAYALTNAGGSPLDWTAAGTQNWLDITPAGGTLAPTDSTVADVCINASANVLAAGVHTDDVTFSNVTSGAVRTRAVELDIELAAGTPSTAPYPHDRRKNRYISFDPNKALNDGRNIAFKVELKSINMGSCDDSAGAQGGNVDFCRVDRGAADCKACSGSGDSCISASIDCPPGESCDPTGAVCVNDLPNSGGSNIGLIWWVGPEKDTVTDPNLSIHLLVSEPFRKESTDWPNPVHAGDCEVVPQASYGVRAVETAGGAESDELVVLTTALNVCSVSAALCNVAGDCPAGETCNPVGSPAPFWWGDVVGVLAFHCNADIREQTCDPNTANGDCTGSGVPAACCTGVGTGLCDCSGGDPCARAWELPNGVTNIDDVTAALWTSAPAPPTTVSADFTWVDVHGNDSFAPGSQNYDPPNYQINVSDLQQIGSAFGGLPYKFYDPADCPDESDWP